MLDESSSYGVLGSKTCRGVTEHFGVPASEIDMIIGSLAGPLCAGGGFCAGSQEIIEHQRYSAAAYTFSAALPGMLATMATEVVGVLSSGGGGEGEIGDGVISFDEGRGERNRSEDGDMVLVKELRRRIAVMRRGLSGVVEMAVAGIPDGLEDWNEIEEEKWKNEEKMDDHNSGDEPLMCCTSAPENPVLIIALQDGLVRTRGWTVDREEFVLQDIVDEVCIFVVSTLFLAIFHAGSWLLTLMVLQVLRHDVLITRVKRMPPALGLPGSGGVTGGGRGERISGQGGRARSGTTMGRDRADEIRPALKVCVTVGLTDEETAGAAEVIRGAVARVLCDGGGGGGEGGGVSSDT